MITKIKSISELPLVRNTAKLSSSSALLMFLPLIVTPILSRLYTPEDYGDWGVFSSVFYVVNSFLFLSYENAIVKTNKAEDVPNLMGLCAIVSSVIIILTVLLFSVGRLVGITFFEQFPSITLLATLLVAQAVHTLANNVANREKQYGMMSIASIVGGVSQASCRIALGIYPIVAYGLIVGNVLAQILTTLFIVVCLWCSVHILWKDFSLGKVLLLAKTNWKFPLFDAPARFIELSLGNVALIIMTFFWSRGDVGCYSMVVQFILLPISIIGSAMGNVFYRELSESIEDSTAISTTTLRAAKITFILSLLPILFLSLGGDKLLVLLLGGQWETAGKMALCLCIYSVPTILSEPLLPVYRSLSRQEIRLRWNIANFLFSLGLLWLSAICFSNLFVSLVIFSISYAIIRYAMFFSVLKLSNVHIRNINRQFFLIQGCCYLFLIIRLVFSI